MDFSKEFKASFGLDSVVIRKYINGIQGGRTLDLTGYSADEKILKAGHVVIYDPTSKRYKPMPISGNSYSSLPDSHVYVGVIARSVSVEDPTVSIMNIGAVNSLAVPFDMTSILSAFKSDVPTIVWEND